MQHNESTSCHTKLKLHFRQFFRHGIFKRISRLEKRRWPFFPLSMSFSSMCVSIYCHVRASKTTTTTKILFNFQPNRTSVKIDKFINISIMDSCIHNSHFIELSNKNIHSNILHSNKKDQGVFCLCIYLQRVRVPFETNYVFMNMMCQSYGSIIGTEIQTNTV